LKVLQKGMTIRQAAEEWVGEMDAIQQGMIEKLMQYEPDDWEEVTRPAKYDHVYVYDESADGEIVGYDEDEEKYIIKLDPNDATVTLSENDFEVEREDILPMWSTMWSFSGLDTEWGESDEGIAALSRCGFRVYRSEEFGIFFGIDGAGYDFYGECHRDSKGQICSEGHWIPLYLERGLHWHDPSTIEKKVVY